MCRYCELDVYRTRQTPDGKVARCLGDWWGRGGWTNNKKKWIHRSSLIQTADKKFRLLGWDEVSSPIEFCPKCGRKLV